MFTLYIEEEALEDNTKPRGDDMLDKQKLKYVEDNFVILTTIPDKKWGVKVTEYLDTSTGEIISAKDAKNTYGVKSIYPTLKEIREKKINSLKDGPRDFANFLLKFRNNSCGFKVGIDLLIEWYAKLKDKRNQHVKRYIKSLVDAGVLEMVEGIPFLHEDFMISTSTHNKVSAKGDVFSAMCLYDNMLAAEGKIADGMVSSTKA